MRGASAESLARLTEELGSAVESGADAARIADDLFAVAAVLRREPSLRRTLTQLSITPDAKAGLARQLLSGELDGSSMDLVATAAAQRWAAIRDLADALEHLGVVAVVMGADRAGRADLLEKELFGFGRLVEKNPGLRDALSNPARSLEDKRALLRRLLDGRSDPATISLAEQSIVGSHRTVSLAIEEYQKIAARHRRRLIATVHVAREMGDADQQRLAGALARQYDRPVHLNVVVDPDVVGGVRVEVGDDVIDGTVASRLDDARRRLAG